MLFLKPYVRERAVRYAERWAFRRNSLFGDFERLGGNCTNFVSQCVYAGSCVMNYLNLFGWYYISLDDRTPSWSGVEYFYNFMTENLGVGPFGHEATRDEVEVGDVVQLYREGEGFYHSLLIVGFSEDDILLAAQSDDAYARPLSTYNFDRERYIKIDGVRFLAEDSGDCFRSVYDGIAIIPGEGMRSPS